MKNSKAPQKLPRQAALQNEQAQPVKALFEGLRNILLDLSIEKIANFCFRLIFLIVLIIHLIRFLISCI